MQAKWQRISGAAACGLYSAVLAYLSIWNDRGDAEIAILVLFFGLGALMGYAIWPEDAAAKLRPSWTRIAGALVIGDIFAVLMTTGFALISGSSPALSNLMTSLLLGVVNAYLAWPSIEREIVLRRERQHAAGAVTMRPGWQRLPATLLTAAFLGALAALISSMKNGAVDFAALAAFTVGLALVLYALWPDWFDRLRLF